VSTSSQVCLRCGEALDELDPRTRCPCGGLLDVRHPAPPWTGPELRAQLASRHAATAPGAGSGVWRYRELILPGHTGSDLISLGEGDTPLLACGPAAGWAGVDALLCKHEGWNPTGSFKDRGMAIGVTQARRVAAQIVACASTGNTSASLAAYAARAGLRALVLIPSGQVASGKLAQAIGYGARTLLVRGDFDDCLRLLEALAGRGGVYPLNSINPFRVEGQKTIMLELLQQLEWTPPDWIVLPAGNLGNTAAFGKALEEALAWGLIDRVPRLAAVQAEGAAAFAWGFEENFARRRRVRAETIATAIRIGDPASWDRAVRSIRRTNGVVTRVSDEEILEAKSVIDGAGIGCEPASAAALAGLRRLVGQGTIRRTESVVAVLTGHLLKDPGSLEAMHLRGQPRGAWANPPLEVDATLEAVVAAAGMG